MLCPHCGESNKTEAKVCKHCGKEMKLETLPDSTQSTQSVSRKARLSKKLYIILGAIVIVGIVFFIYEKKQPPPQPKMPPTNDLIIPPSEQFFDSLRERIDEVGDAKKYYQAARQIMATGEVPAIPTPMPEMGSTSRYFKVAENFARALEHFKHAKEALAEVKIKSPGEEECRREFIDADEKYIEASKILNEAAKALSTDGDSKKLQMVLTDAKAKYEIGEELMSAFLL